MYTHPLHCLQYTCVYSYENCPPPATSDPPLLSPPYIVRTILIYTRSHCMPVYRGDPAVSAVTCSWAFACDAQYCTTLHSTVCVAIFSDNSQQHFLCAGSKYMYVYIHIVYTSNCQWMKGQRCECCYTSHQNVSLNCHRVFQPFVYMYSACMLQWCTSVQAHDALTSSPHFFLDLMYAHEPPNMSNMCEVSLSLYT